MYIIVNDPPPKPPMTVTEVCYSFAIVSCSKTNSSLCPENYSAGGEVAVVEESHCEEGGAGGVEGGRRGQAEQAEEAGEG